MAIIRTPGNTRLTFTYYNPELNNVSLNNINPEAGVPQVASFIMAVQDLQVTNATMREVRRTLEEILTEEV